MLASLFARVAWLLCFYVVALAACTTTTEVKVIDCERIEFFPPGATSASADSAVYRDCDPPEWDGLVVRFVP